MEKRIFSKKLDFIFSRDGAEASKMLVVWNANAKKGAWFPKRPDFFSNLGRALRRVAFLGAKNRAKITRFLALTNPVKREAP